MSFLSARKKAILKWGNDRLWHRWPLMLWSYIKFFKNENGYFPNIFWPRSLNEKILYRMLFDRRDFLPILTGKLESRDFVRRRMGTDAALIPLIGVVYEPEDITRLQLPNRFILKASHGSAMNYIHTGEAPPDIDHLKELCREWLKHDFAKYTKEWCYKHVKRAIVVEPLITDEHGEIPVDYKFFCYDGVPRFIRMDSGRFTTQVADLFDCEWNFIPGRTYYPNSEIIPPKPPHFDAMLAMAATLSRGIDFIRVDLYDVAGQAWFGELTNTPAHAGYMFEPRELDYEFGKYWKISTTQGLPDAYPPARANRLHPDRSLAWKSVPAKSPASH
jgi:hypothetical protein